LTVHGAPGARVGLPAGVGGHYRLDVDPDRLTAAAQGLAALGEDLAQQSTQITHAAQIPPQMWAGTARDTVCAEMTGLAGQTTRFVGHFHTAATALSETATACREAVAHVTDLNRRWQAAQDSYEADLKTLRAQQDRQTAALDPAMNPTARKLTVADLTDSYAQAQGDTGRARDTTVRRLDGDYQQVVDGLRARFRQAGAAVAAATMVAVPDSTVSGFVAGGGTGMMPGWCTRDGGVFPPDLHAELVLESGLPMLHQRDVAADVARVQPYLQQWIQHAGPIDPQIAAILARRADDPAFATPIVKALGPDGLITAIRGAQALSTQDWRQPDAWQHNPDKGAVHQQVMAFQDSTATTLARMLAAASRDPNGLPAGFAAHLIRTDPEVASILFTYADRAHVSFGGTFMHDAGSTLVGMERNGGNGYWYDRTTGDGFGTNADAGLFRDPTLAFLKAADNSVDSAQGVLSDNKLLKYFLTEQPSYVNGRGEATAGLLREATINHARDPVPPGTDPKQSSAWRAADIAAWALHDAAEGTPLPQTRLAIAGIVATYLPDVQRALLGGDGDPGVVDHTGDRGWPPSVLGSDGWPQFGAVMSRTDLQDVLAHVGGDEASRKLIAQTATAFSAITIDRGAAANADWQKTATIGQTGPFERACDLSAGLTGFLVSGLASGDISDAKSDAERRSKVAALFLLPTQFIPMDKCGPAAPVAGMLLDGVKEAVTKAYVGDGVEQATKRGTQDWIITSDALALQALEAARVHGLLSDTEKTAWPHDGSGHLKSITELTPGERADLLTGVGNSSGYAATARNAIDDSRSIYRNPLSGN
jgi:uncharacterized protein YukE